jgi:hypothetical protein
VFQVYKDPFSAKVRQYSKVDPSLNVVSHEARADEIDYEITLTDYEKKQRNPPRTLNWAEPISRRQNRVGFTEALKDLILF